MPEAAGLRLRSGVDLTELPRFARIAEHDRWRRTVFTAAELAPAAHYGPARRLTYLAGRFSAKEAVAKGLGTGFLAAAQPGGRPVHWRDIEILRDGEGRPEVRLHRAALDSSRKLRLGRIDVSISHQPSLAVAFAVAPQEPADPGPRGPDAP